MTETEPTSINEDPAKCDGQLRNELQIISMVLHLVDPELSTDPNRLKQIVQHGHSALNRMADILDGRAPHSVTDVPAKLVVVNHSDGFMA
jgi:hypothetical protein